MKKKFVPVFFSILLLTGAAVAAETIASSRIETPLAKIKMMDFVTACDSIQLANLINRNPDLDINEGVSAPSPLNIAQARYLRAIAGNDDGYINACKATMRTIIGSKGYKTIDAPIGRMTDLMYLLIGTKDFTASQIKQVVTFIFPLLQQVSDYDIYRRTISATDELQPRNVVNLLATLGNGSCQQSCRVTSSSQPYYFRLGPFRIEPNFVLQFPVPCCTRPALRAA